jgi:ATP-dependent Clp protease ATP-binding subunit ClpC
MGARPLRRAIQRHIEDPLADFVLMSELEPGSTILVDRKEGADDVDISVVAGPDPREPVAVPADGGPGEPDEAGDDDSGDGSTD